MYQLACAKYNDILKLEKEVVKEGRWRGLPLSLMLIDVRGFVIPENDIKPFITRNRSKVIGWQGAKHNNPTLIEQGWNVPQDQSNAWPGVLNFYDPRWQV
jgi:hypothetical protein